MSITLKTKHLLLLYNKGQINIDKIEITIKL